MENLVRPRIPFLSAAMSAPTPIFDPTINVYPRSEPLSGGAYNYNAAQLHQVTGDGIRVSSSEPNFGARPRVSAPHVNGHIQPQVPSPSAPQPPAGSTHPGQQPGHGVPRHHQQYPTGQSAGLGVHFHNTTQQAPGLLQSTSTQQQGHQVPVCHQPVQPPVLTLSQHQAGFSNIQVRANHPLYDQQQHQAPSDVLYQHSFPTSTHQQHQYQTGQCFLQPTPIQNHSASVQHQATTVHHCYT